ncbi:hypothetical protein ACIBSV_48815 [Embleya sp. NPDC050154]|uniref:hypothetical protein n=1 Tax=Embleya sp. NPDC050154 TaxID=3363988 RepID=UPI0037AF23DD
MTTALHPGRQTAAQALADHLGAVSRPAVIIELPSTPQGGHGARIEAWADIEGGGVAVSVMPYVSVARKPESHPIAELFMPSWATRAEILGPFVEGILTHGPRFGTRHGGTHKALGDLDLRKVAARLGIGTTAAGLHIDAPWDEPLILVQPDPMPDGHPDPVSIALYGSWNNASLTAALRPLIHAMQAR